MRRRRQIFVAFVAAAVALAVAAFVSSPGAAAAVEDPALTHAVVGDADADGNPPPTP